MIQHSNPQDKPNTDHLSIYNLPALNSVIDRYEMPQSNDENLESENQSGSLDTIQKINF